MTKLNKLCYIGDSEPASMYFRGILELMKQEGKIDFEYVSLSDLESLADKKHFRI